MQIKIDLAVASCFSLRLKVELVLHFSPSNEKLAHAEKMQDFYTKRSLM